MATASDPLEVIDHFVSLPMVAEVDSRGTTKATVRLCSFTFLSIRL